METGEIQIKRLSSELVSDFFKFHDNLETCGWCYCVAWWVPTWKGFIQRTAFQNRQLREKLFATGEYGGYLLYLDDEPRGWCQVGPRDRLQRLLDQHNLAPEPDIWAITCFLIDKQLRREGYARRMLEAILEDLRRQKVRIVEAYPHKQLADDPDEMWAGPVTIYQEAGFRPVSESGKNLVMRLEL